MLNMPKPLSERLYQRVTAEPFAGRVHQAAPVARRSSSIVIEEAASPVPGLIERLQNLQPQSSSLRKQRENLLSMLRPLIDEAEELEAAILEEQQAHLRAQLDEVCGQGRQQQEIVDGLSRQLQHAELDVRRAMGRAESARDAVEALARMEANGSNLPKWPRKEEIEKWDRRVSAAADKMKRAADDSAAAMQERERVKGDLTEAARKLDAISKQATRLEGQLSGESWTDPEYGLVVPASR